MSYAEARRIDVAEIPVIDVAPLMGGDPGGTAQVAAAMLAAAEGIGFFYVRNHGIAEDLIASVDAAARAFFAQPLAAKEALAPRDRHRGFLGAGQAKMYEHARIDLKESFIWGLDVGTDDPDYLAGNRMIGPNRWPAFPPGMRPTLNAYFDAANACGRALLRGFAVSLGVAADTLSARFAKPVTRCTLIYYPPQPPDLGSEQFGVAPHTDYGVLTLLHQDDVGGLQVWSQSKEWVTAHPLPGTLVVNVGDLLARWTNDRFRSTPHRVVNASGRERVSIAAFVDPDHDTPIAPVCALGTEPRYAPTTCGEYILGRFDKAFAYRKP
jgi:isopenicillin N synthase-like dioxygenase